MSNQLTLFNYEQLDSETRIVAQQRAGEIKTLMRSTAEAVMQVGEKLLEVQTRLGNGQFEAWLEAEFDWSRRTAYNFIGVFKEFRGRANFAQMDVATSALYLLAAPSTPAEVRAEVLERAEAGERITHGDVKAAVSEAKAKRQPALPTPPPAVAPWEEDDEGEAEDFPAARPLPPPPPAREDVPPPAPYAPQHSTAAGPPPAPVAPPPPPPINVSAAAVQLSLTLRQGGALITARQGDGVPRQWSTALDAVGERVQAIVNEYFPADDMPEWLK